MIISKGSTVIIDKVSGVLAEDVTISLKSQFSPLMSDLQNDKSKLVAVAGATTRSLFGVGFSTQFKQATTQIWDKTDPARFNLNVEFHRTFNGGKGVDGTVVTGVSGRNVMAIVQYLCKIPLPRETFGSEGVGGAIGMLEPPGPSPIEGIGLDKIMNKEKAVDVERRGIVNVTIGNMRFNRLLMESAEPTFCKYADDSGFPISCRIAFSFASIWAATDAMVDEWKGG
jgi:hypothetical protein